MSVSVANPKVHILKAKSNGGGKLPKTSVAVPKGSLAVTSTGGGISSPSSPTGSSGAFGKVAFNK